MSGRRKPPPGEGVPQPPLTWQDLPDDAFIGGKRENNGTVYNWDFFQAHPERIVPGALNNFQAKFPGGRARALHEDALREMPDLASQMQDEAKLFSAIDQAARQVGVDLAQIQRQLEEIDRLFEAGKEDESLALFACVREQIIPVYKRMRELGYTHKDLAT